MPYLASRRCLTSHARPLATVEDPRDGRRPLPPSGTGNGDAPADDSRRIELWHALAAAVLLLLLAEGLLVQR